MFIHYVTYYDYGSSYKSVKEYCLSSALVMCKKLQASQQ